MSTVCIDNYVTLPGYGYSRMARVGIAATHCRFRWSAFRPVGIKAATDCTRVLRRPFTLHYCTIVAVSATSDTARLSRYRYLPYGGVG